MLHEADVRDKLYKLLFYFIFRFFFFEKVTIVVLEERQFLEFKEPQKIKHNVNDYMGFWKFENISLMVYNFN